MQCDARTDKNRDYIEQHCRLNTSAAMPHNIYLIRKIVLFCPPCSLCNYTKTDRINNPVGLKQLFITEFVGQLVIAHGFQRIGNCLSALQHQQL